MRLVLIRHGATPGNEAHAYVGARTDEGLSAAGRAAVAAKGAFPQVEYVYVSPMLRARQTVALLFPCALQHEVADLREMDFGAFEGRTAAQMEHDAAYRAWVNGWCAGPCPQGESRAVFADRVERAVIDIVADARARGLADVFVVAHGGTVMSALDRLAVAPEDSAHARADAVGSAVQPSAAASAPATAPTPAAVSASTAAVSDPAAAAQRYFSWSVPPCEGWVADVVFRSSDAAATGEAPAPFALAHPRRIDFAARTNDNSRTTCEREET
jgi:alpha-ribazole phosphatase